MDRIMSSDKNDTKQIATQMHGFIETGSTTIGSPAISPYQRAIHSQTPSTHNTIEQMMFSNQFATNITIQRPPEKNQSNSESQTKPLTKAELRKSNKPIMEKKRRARINHCLNELKTLILEAMKKDPARHTKLEKADILEMTVKYLQNLHRNPSMNITIPSDPVTVHRFRDGFSDCTNEVNRYINEMDGIDVNVKRRLMGHLSNCVNHMPQSNPINCFTATDDNSTSNLFSPTITANNNNNNNSFWSSMSHQMSSTTSLTEKNDVQFIPSRLSSGELALIIPNSVNMNYFSATGSFSLNQLSKSMEQSTSFNVAQPLKTKQIDTSPPLSPTSSISSIDSDVKQNTSDYYSSLENSFQTPKKPQPIFATSSSCNSSFEQSSFNSSNSSIIVPMALLPPPPPPPSTITATLTTTATTTTTTTLQQQHVTSTTEQSVGKFENHSAKNENNSMWRPW